MTILLVSVLSMSSLTSACAGEEGAKQLHEDSESMPLIVITSTEEAERHGILVLAEEAGVPSGRTIDVMICIPRDKEVPQGMLPVFVTHLKEGEKTLFRVSYEPSRDYYRAVVGSHYIATMQVEPNLVEHLYVEMIYLDEDKSIWKGEPPGGFALAMKSLLRTMEFDEFTAGLAGCGFKL